LIFQNYFSKCTSTQCARSKLTAENKGGVYCATAPDSGGHHQSVQDGARKERKADSERKRQRPCLSLCLQP